MSSMTSLAKIWRSTDSLTLAKASDGKRIRVKLLDGRHVDIVVQPSLLTSELEAIIASNVALKEADRKYFGLAFKDEKHDLVRWLKSEKRVLEHHLVISASTSSMHSLRKPHWPSMDNVGRVGRRPRDPSIGRLEKRKEYDLMLYYLIRLFVDVKDLGYPSTSELFFLQAKMDLFNSQVCCDSKTLVHLTAYALRILQAPSPAEVSQVTSAVQDLLAEADPQVRSELLDADQMDLIVEVYQRLMQCNPSRGNVIVRFMNTVESLISYGVHYYAVTDKQDKPWTLGLCRRGIFQFSPTNRATPARVLPWKQIENLQYRERRFTVDYRAHGDDPHSPHSLPPVFGDRPTPSLSANDLNHDTMPFHDDLGEVTSENRTSLLHVPNAFRGTFRRRPSLSSLISSSPSNRSDAASDVGVSQQPAVVSVHFHCSDTRTAKMIYSMSVDQHTHYLDRKNLARENRDKSKVKTTDAELASALDRLVSVSLLPTLPGTPEALLLQRQKDRSRSVGDVGVEVDGEREQENHEEIRKDLEDMEQRLKERKRKLEEDRTQKLSELQALIEKENTDKISKLENDISVQESIVKAAAHLVNETQYRKIRQKRRQEYDRKVNRLNTMRNTLKHLQNGESVADTASELSAVSSEAKLDNVSDLSVPSTYNSADDLSSGYHTMPSHRPPLPPNCTRVHPVPRKLSHLAKLHPSSSIDSFAPGELSLPPSPRHRVLDSPSRHKTLQHYNSVGSNLSISSVSSMPSSPFASRLNNNNSGSVITNGNVAMYSTARAQALAKVDDAMVAASSTESLVSFGHHSSLDRRLLRHRHQRQPSLLHFTLDVDGPQVMLQHASPTRQTNYVASEYPASPPPTRESVRAFTSADAVQYSERLRHQRGASDLARLADQKPRMRLNTLV